MRKRGSVVISTLRLRILRSWVQIPSGTRIVDFQKGRFCVDWALIEYTLCILGGEGEEMATALIYRVMKQEGANTLWLYDH